MLSKRTEAALLNADSQILHTFTINPLTVVTIALGLGVAAADYSGADKYLGATADSFISIEEGMVISGTAIALWLGSLLIKELAYNNYLRARALDPD